MKLIDFIKKLEFWSPIVVIIKGNVKEYNSAVEYLMKYHNSEWDKLIVRDSYISLCKDEYKYVIIAS